MEGQKKIAFFEFSDFSGGSNSIENAIRIKPTQVQPTTIGCMLRKSGFLKYPGAIGLSATTTFTDYLRMMSIYRAFDTTEQLVALSAGHLYFVNQTDGSLTDKYTMGTVLNPGVSCEAYNKMFVCNGNSVVKIEGTNVYRVGIVPPSGVAAAASAGAGLPDGVYDVIFGYARRIGGIDVLYSSGQTAAISVTLGSGNNRITVSSFANSSDPQVGDKVVWIKSPSETVHYFFYGTGDNTTTTFIISGTGAKSATNIYESFALDNGLPPYTGTFIYSFANRLWMIKSNVIYYSAKAYNEYDIEKFPSANFIITPYNITGIFSVGSDLFFNTESGIVKMSNADPNSILYLIEPRWHFFDMNTVDRWNNGTIGLTNDGVRYFNGDTFTDYDMSYHIKTKIDEALKVKSNFRPCGFVYRRAIRNEYHLLWQDENVSTSVNNMHAILNLDSFSYTSPDSFNAAWEFQPYSGNFAAVNKTNNALFIGQTHVAAPKIIMETVSNDLLNYMYTPDGTLLAVETPYSMKLVSRIALPALNALCWFQRFRVLLENNSPVNIQFVLPDRDFDNSGRSEITQIPAPYGGTARYDISKYDESYYPIEQAFVFVHNIYAEGMGENFSGRELSIEITQTDNDPNLSIMATQLQYTFETGNFI
jgi:hypothetical protein